MALLFETGTWTGNNATPQTITLRDSTLTPKAILCWAIGTSPLGGTFAAQARFSAGFGARQSESTQSGCVGFINLDNVATSDAARVRNTTLLHLLATATTTDYTVLLDSFGAGQFVVSYSSAANANSDVFHYCVWGGGDSGNAVVLNWTMDATSGTELITGAGFQPTMLFALDSDLATANAITAGLGFSFGFASSPTQFQSTALTATDGDTATSTMNWNKAFRSDACLERLTTNADTSDARWDLDSFDSDGVTLGVVDGPSSVDRVATFLLIQGGQWEAGNRAKDTVTGSDIFTLANTNLTPNGMLMFMSNQTAVGIVAGDTNWSLGANDKTLYGTAGTTGPEAINTQTDRFQATDFAIEELTGGATPAETSSARLSLSAFTISNNTATPSLFSSQDCAESNNSATWPDAQFAQAATRVTGGTASGDNGIGIALRMSVGVRTFYRFVVNAAATNNVGISKFVAGVYTNLGFRTGVWANDDILRGEVNGSTLKVFQNAVQLGADITDSAIATGRPGVCSSTTLTSGSLTNWSAGSLTGPTTLASDNFIRANNQDMGPSWDHLSFGPGSFELKWSTNGGSAALIAYLAFGDTPLLPPRPLLSNVAVHRAASW